MQDYYDIFKKMNYFPIKDNSGKIVAFSGRTMSKEKKYQNIIIPRQNSNI